MSFENSMTISFTSVKNQCFNLIDSTLIGVTFWVLLLNLLKVKKKYLDCSIYTTLKLLSFGLYVYRWSSNFSSKYRFNMFLIIICFSLLSCFYNSPRNSIKLFKNSQSCGEVLLKCINICQVFFEPDFFRTFKSSKSCKLLYLIQHKACTIFAWDTKFCLQQLKY